MRRRWRLRRRADFQRVLGSGPLFSGRALIGFARLAPPGEVKIGVAASRQVRGAVARNRARRRLREAARLELRPGGLEVQAGGTGYHVVLMARRPALDVPFPNLGREVAAVRERLPRGGA